MLPQEQHGKITTAALNVWLAGLIRERPKGAVKSRESTLWQGAEPKAHAGMDSGSARWPEFPPKLPPWRHHPMADCHAQE